MIVEVKQEHIENGIKGTPCYCALSLAVYDALADKYKFSDSESLDIDNEEVNIGESWIETAVQGAGAEISIYTKLENKVVEDIVIIDSSLERNKCWTMGVDFRLGTYQLEDWIENFDTFDDSEPISFKVEDIHRMQQ